MAEISVPYFVPQISEAEIAGVAETIRSNWLTSGPKMAEFERRFGEAVGAEHAVAVNSCTAALHLALVVAGIGPGDEVIVPTMTFAATAAVVIHVGATPVLVDVDPTTLLIEPVFIEGAVTSRTRAIIPVHYAGQVCDMEAIQRIADAHDLVVIEDAAHAFPAQLNDRRVGSIGDMTCFSFYANKTLTTGEGGMLTTSNPEFAERAAQLRLHGLNKQAWDRYRHSGAWDYDIAEPGYKYNLTDIAAAIGLGQLEHADGFWKRRQVIADLYQELLEPIDGVDPLAVLPHRQHAWHLFVVRIDETQTGIHRDAVIEQLNGAGVGTSVHYRPLHMHSHYRDNLGYDPRKLPNATAAFGEIVSLPIYPGLPHESVHRVTAILRTICT